MQMEIEAKMFEPIKLEHEYIFRCERCGLPLTVRKDNNYKIFTVFIKPCDFCTVEKEEI